MGRLRTCDHCGTEFETITKCRLHQEECDDRTSDGDLVADYRDPFAPDRDGEREMRCLHCGETFNEQEIVYERRFPQNTANDQPLWWCPNEDCDGRGVGFDLHEV